MTGLYEIRDRKGRIENLENPFSCVIGSTQYDTLRSIYKEKRELLAKGYWDRVLFIAPNNLKKEKDNDLELDPVLYSQYKELIFQILDDTNFGIEMNNEYTRTLKLTDPAKKIIADFKEDIRIRCNKSSDRISSMLGKYDILIYRLALNLQVMYWSAKEAELIQVEERAAKGAVELAYYFIDNAIKIHQFTTDKTVAVKLDSDVLKWYNGLPRTGVTVKMALDLAEKMRKKGANALSEAYIYVYLRRADLFEKTARGIYDRVG